MSDVDEATAATGLTLEEIRANYEAKLKKVFAEGRALELREAWASQAAASTGPTILAKASPSPKKRQRAAEALFLRNDASSSYSSRIKAEVEKPIVPDVFVESSKFDSMVKREPKESQLRALAPIRKSNYLDGIENIGRQTKENAARREQPRTLGFNDVPVPSIVSRSASKGKGKEKSSAYDNTKPSMSRFVPPPEPKPTSRIGSSKEAAYVSIKHSDDDISEVEDEEADLEITNKPKISRHKDGTMIERIPMGPIYFKPSKADPQFDTFEPNSGTRLKSRTLSHHDLQLHLTDRYHLSPSVLYSIVRPSKGGGNLDVPVVGDFVIIGVLAEKGETSFINANALKKDIKDEDSEKKKKWDHVKGAEEEKEDDEEEEPDETFRPQSKSQKKRRFIRFSLVDLSTPTSSATGSGTLTLLLFESDSSDLVTEDGGKKRGNYRGGSGGAYEKWWKESEGAVVAVLNPKVMKQMPGKPMAITPDSADSIILIGRSKDYRSCSARTQEGKVCSKLFDGRSSEACAYHSQLRLRKTAANRPETYSTTASLGSTTMFNAKSFNSAFKGNGNKSTTSKQPFCDPENKKGLLPRQQNKVMIEGVLTYLSAGPSGGTPSAPQSLGNARKRLSANELKASAITSSAMTANGLYGRAGSKGITVAQAKKDRDERKREKELRKEEMEKLLTRGEEFGDTSLGAVYLQRADQEKREKMLREKAKEKKLKERLKLKEKEQKRKRKSKAGEDHEDSDDDDSSESDQQGTVRNIRSRSTTATIDGGPLKKKRANPFSVEALRLIGYDPTRNTDLGRKEDEADKLAQPRSATVKGLINRPADRPTPKLSAPPGKKIRSGVFVPKSISSPKAAKSEEDEDEDDDLMVVGGPSN